MGASEVKEQGSTVPHRPSSAPNAHRTACPPHHRAFAHAVPVSDALYQLLDSSASERFDKGEEPGMFDLESRSGWG